MLGFQEYESRRLWFQIALFRLHYKKFDVVTVPASERFGDQAGDVLMLESFHSCTIHLQDQLADFEAAAAVSCTVFLQRYAYVVRFVKTVPCLKFSNLLKKRAQCLYKIFSEILLKKFYPTCSSHKSSNQNNLSSEICSLLVFT